MTRDCLGGETSLFGQPTPPTPRPAGRGELFLTADFASERRLRNYWRRLRDGLAHWGVNPLSERPRTRVRGATGTRSGQRRNTRAAAVYSNRSARAVAHPHVPQHTACSAVAGATPPNRLFKKSSPRPAGRGAGGVGCPKSEVPQTPKPKSATTKQTPPTNQTSPPQHSCAAYKDGSSSTGSC